MAPFIMLSQVILSYKSVDKILKCDYSTESYVLRNTFLFYYAKAILTFESLDEILQCDHSNKSH